MSSEKGSRRWCFVPCCTSSSAKTPGKLFVSVPMDVKTRRMWASAARREDAKTLTSRNPWYCCEDHFEPENDFANYQKQKLMGGRILMKKGVLPHKFACQPRRNKETSLRLSYHKRQQKNIAAHAMIEYEEQIVHAGGAVDKHTVDSELSEVRQTEVCQATTQATQTEVCQVATQATQTEEGTYEAMELGVDMEMEGECAGKGVGSGMEPEYAGQDTVSDTEYSQTSTESESGEEEEEGIDYVSLHRTRTMCKKFPKRYVGVPADALFVLERLATEVIEPLQGSGAKINPYDICLLVLMKVKQDRQFIYLADDFGISRSQAGRIFARYVNVIADALSDFIIWPTEEMIKKHLPLAFKARFSSVTCIIDCLEIEIEKPSAALDQSLTWSSYKSCNTLKYLISITPNGLINFVSEGFGGRASDMAVLKRSTFLSHLKPGMVIMADRGFKAVEPVLVNEGCSLVRPESVTANAVLEKDQVLWSKQVASLRIHVERAIRRVREFAMLRPHAVVDAKLSDYADSCMRIACGLVNTQLPLTKV